MEKEEKGLFARLSAFWREGIDGGGGDGIGFWSGAKGHSGGRSGTAAPVRGAGARRFPQEEEKTAGKRIPLFSEGEKGRKGDFAAAEDPTQTLWKKERELLMGEALRKETRSAAAENGLGQAFLRGLPEEGAE